MSRKNHKMIDGRLLQTNKKYSQLKMKQKEKIAEWMFQATRDYYMKKCTFPSDKHLEEVVDIVYEKIEDAEIWILQITLKRNASSATAELLFHF